MKKFVLKNLFHRPLTDSEIRVLDKVLNFVPIPEKIDRIQIKNDLKSLRKDQVKHSP